MYKYFVSYSFTDNSNNTGLGYCSVGRVKKIEDFDELEYMAETIEKEYKFKRVVILNYKLLSEEEDLWKK